MTLYLFDKDTFKIHKHLFAQQEELARVSRDKECSLARHWTALRGWKTRMEKKNFIHKNKTTK